MHLKFTIQGLWIYATVLAYLLAFVGLLFIKSKKIAGRLYTLGFVLAQCPLDRSTRSGTFLDLFKNCR